MKLEGVEYKNPMTATDNKVKSVTISNHGVEYTITSDFFGLHVRVDSLRACTMNGKGLNCVIVHGSSMSRE